MNGDVFVSEEPANRLRDVRFKMKPARGKKKCILSIH